MAANEVSRDMWRRRHNKRHSDAQHIQLLRSGRFATPEATHVLAPLGIIPLIDLVLDQEVKHAMGTAPRAPINDAEDM